MKLPFSFVEVEGVAQSSTLAQPSIDERRGVPVEITKGWKYQTMILAKWRLAFRAVENADDAGATVKQIKKEVSFLNDKSNFRTPSKKRKERMMTDESAWSMGIADFSFFQQT